ncbi:META domain-containing protein [Hydrogenophaga sp. 5NK40-0174]|uniref:META domain-containing protein n=1 Tax=Hydrogenophaga sp. 5NK40-0174 TaxID=3127649 RepID=UPI003106E68C
MRFLSAPNRQFWVSLGGALSLSMVACTSNGASSSPAAPQLAGTQWEVQSIGGQAVSGGKVPTLAFSASMDIGGHGGCNEYSGQVSLKGTALTVGPVMATKMSCGPVQDRLESAFLSALRNAKQVKVKDGLLELTGASEAPTVVFRQVKP